ncbi:hypothetical protein ACFQ8O_03275 [Streptomyces coelicoflavus]|uniref:hypothetical protein n=1 Tax=Streptomyces coelicoflavus TaxID=285562 RepID=UPI0036D1B2F8
MGSAVVLEKWPVLGRHERAAEWLRIWTDLGRAPRTIDAYARGLAEYLLVCERDGIAPISAKRLHVAAFVKEPMTLFELQEWPGHRTPEATSHYVARAYNDAGYFARNVRTIEVLFDRGAVASGAAADGEPWQYYGLGHGWCTYTFFEQCQHRMACARCDFYTPKNSSKGQLPEAKENLQKMLASIPLTDVPTPAGPTPRQIGVPATATLLPVVDVRQGRGDRADPAGI